MLVPSLFPKQAPRPWAGKLTRPSCLHLTEPGLKCLRGHHILEDHQRAVQILLFGERSCPFPEHESMLNTEHAIRAKPLDTISRSLCFLRKLYLFFKFLFGIGVRMINNTAIVSGGRQRDSAIH